MSYRHIDSETLLRRIAELVEARRELDAQLRVLTGMRRGRRVAKWLPRLVFLLFAGVLLVVALLVAVAVLPRTCSGSQIDGTRSDAQTISSGVQMYVADNPGGDCPTIEDLTGGGYINASTSTRDGWDHDFHIRCPSDEIYVVSAGPDGVFFTEDDIE